VTDSLELGALLSAKPQHTLQQDGFLPRCSCLRDSEPTFRTGALPQNPDSKGPGSLPAGKVNCGTTSMQSLEMTVF